MSRSPAGILVSSLTCAFALVLTGCDRESAETAQPQETAAEEAAAGEAELTGKIDRSFAGTAMPVAVVKDPAGAELDFAALKGTPVLLNLWATWCVPCVAEMPLLDKLAADTEGELTVLTVSEDLKGAEAIVPFFAKNKLANLPQWHDTDNALAVAFGGGAGLPLTVLYDAEGKEVWRVAGGYDWGGAEARAQIAEAMDAG
ncbi:MAG: hypothetical protein B7Z08_12150 [Sphingomonadales bacterium 32-68-7]|nr:MAG: hypothetical protein B7Z33_11020 [Sphingomonadales bacterium 12-68-11]OYX07552.1 MAG: hypothetical protein B7Z08_12150 [Sphingomonadales bacterium 32-68-7]